MDSGRTQGERIRALFRGASTSSIIAPFIKVNALRSLLEEIPDTASLRCVTRWLPQEVAAGVSDPEIFEVLRQRGSFSLFLADRLHAKLYIADDRCLAGSANVTQAGLGESANAHNIEVLIETTVDDPAIIETLDAIEKEAIPATSAMADIVRCLADALGDFPDQENGRNKVWHPISRQPGHAFRFYAAPARAGRFVSSADRLVLLDIAKSNLQPGLTEKEFREAIRTLLAAIPVSRTILNTSTDYLLTRAEVSPYLEEIATEEYRAPQLWQAFVSWMSYFYDDRVMRHEVSELALRRAQRMGDS